METCPHCNFLVRDGARSCGVCHKPLWDESGVPAFISGDRRQSDAMAARIGPAEAGFPVSIVVLFVVGVMFAVAVVATSHFWA